MQDPINILNKMQQLKNNFWKILIVLNSVMLVGLYVFAINARLERKKLEGNQKSILVNQDSVKENQERIINDLDSTEMYIKQIK